MLSKTPPFFLLLFSSTVSYSDKVKWNLDLSSSVIGKIVADVQ